uniref:Uncharacterized protein n=1 Tax=Oryza barthii TaxID=65489 RepID=A0A0D3H500_9ORYZ
MGDIIPMFVILPSCRLHQLLPMDNFDYGRRTSYICSGAYQTQGSYLQFGLENVLLHHGAADPIANCPRHYQLVFSTIRLDSATSVGRLCLHHQPADPIAVIIADWCSRLYALMGDIIPMFVILPSCRLHQLLPMDNFDYEGQAIYVQGLIKHKDHTFNLDLFRIHST